MQEHVRGVSEIAPASGTPASGAIMQPLPPLQTEPTGQSSSGSMPIVYGVHVPTRPA
jgi:hypothetical protein